MIPFYLINCLALITVYASGDAHPGASLLLAASFLVSLACFSHAVFARSLSATSFAYLLYATYGFILPGLMQLRSDRFYWINNSVRRELIPDAATLVFVSTVAFAIGYFARTASARPEPPGTTAPALSVTRSAALSRATFAVCLLAFAYLAVNVQRYGPLSFIGTRFTTSLAQSAGAGGVSGIGLAFTLTRGLAIAAFAISGFVLWRMRQRDVLTVSAFGLSCVTLAIANFPPALPRFWLVATILAVLMSAFSGWFRRWKVLLFAAAPLLLFFVFPVLQAYNRRSESLNFEVSLTSPLQSMLHGDYDGVQAAVNVMGLVGESGLAFGGRLLSSLLFFVPRSIWSGKYQPTGSEAADTAGYHFLNISAPLPAEFFADFHYVGAVLGMGLIGWAVRSLDDIYEAATRPLVAMVAIILAGFAPIIGRGPLLGIIAAPASSLFLLALWFILLRLRLGRGGQTRDRPHAHRAP
ncbi:hypothetical protein [Pacificoceanicola onchidii]|uniref:hypothetical protein n=1 Tax=Pacificoceanicola onchidii TaxID=2562685 RepID=UPI0010A67AE9|nr:hypothetical protein [Pacificoceanicola onchidii]